MGVFIGVYMLPNILKINGFIKLSDHSLISWYLIGIYNKHPLFTNICKYMTLVFLVEVSQ